MLRNCLLQAALNLAAGAAAGATGSGRQGNKALPGMQGFGNPRFEPVGGRASNYSPPPTGSRSNGGNLSRSVTAAPQCRPRNCTRHRLNTLPSLLALGFTSSSDPSESALRTALLDTNESLWYWKVLPKVRGLLASYAHEPHVSTFFHMNLYGTAALGPGAVRVGGAVLLRGPLAAPSAAQAQQSAVLCRQPIAVVAVSTCSAIRYSVPSL